jgi:hypothetical protein
LRAIPPNNTRACSIEYNSRSMRDLPSRGYFQNSSAQL